MDNQGRPGGAAEAVPSSAREIFGPRLILAQRYVSWLEGVAVDRGLIGPREVGRLWERHVLNCAVVADLIPRQCEVVDIGSGAGLPGIVLAIARPDLSITLLDSQLRRTTFLTECVDDLGLAGVTVCRGRAEDVAGDVVADVAVARAVAPIDRLVAWGLPLLRPGGLLLALKGDRAEEELAPVAAELVRLGARDAEVVRVGRGRVEPATTVIRVVAGGRRAGRAGGRRDASRRADRKATRGR